MVNNILTDTLLQIVYTGTAPRGTNNINFYLIIGILVI